MSLLLHVSGHNSGGINQSINVASPALHLLPSWAKNSAPRCIQDLRGCSCQQGCNHQCQSQQRPGWHEALQAAYRAESIIEDTEQFSGAPLALTSCLLADFPTITFSQELQHKPAMLGSRVPDLQLLPLQNGVNVHISSKVTAVAYP